MPVNRGAPPCHSTRTRIAFMLGVMETYSAPVMGDDEEQVSVRRLRMEQHN